MTRRRRGPTCLSSCRVRRFDADGTLISTVYYVCDLPETHVGDRHEQHDDKGRRFAMWVTGVDLDLRPAAEVA